MISMPPQGEILADIATILSTELGVQSSDSIDMENAFLRRPGPGVD